MTDNRKKAARIFAWGCGVPFAVLMSLVLLGAVLDSAETPDAPEKPRGEKVTASRVPQTPSPSKKSASPTFSPSVPASISPSAKAEKAVPSYEAPDTYYSNCAEVREAGKAPIYRGQPGYGKHLDRDRDGVGCDR